MSVCININEAVCWLASHSPDSPLIKQAEALLEQIGSTIQAYEEKQNSVEFILGSSNTQPLGFAGLCCRFVPRSSTSEIPTFLADEDIEVTQWNDTIAEMQEEENAD